jgi:serine/threonine protein phosphatase PrpC
MKNEATGLLRRNGWRAAAATDCGRVRDHNEDVYRGDVDAGIFLVVDGVGGHAAGEVAAHIAADRIQRRVERQDAPAHVRVREAITLANREILLKAASDPQLAGMACVLTLAVLDGDELTIGHVGDSRLYRLDARGISKITHDHSPVGELEDAREISETDAMRDDRRNEVYRDVGSEPRDPESDDFIELIRTRLDADAAILICSDGLTDMLPALEVNRIARQHAGAPDAAVAALISAANEVGGKDNVTVLIVEGPQYRGVPDAGRAYPPAASESQEPTLPLADPVVAPPATPQSGSSAPATQSNVATGFVYRFMHSRAVALVAGVVLGLLVPLGLPNVPEAADPRPPDRVLTVGGTEPTTFATIGAALAGAHSGDVVQVEPGEYSESLTVPEGVEVRASQPGKAVLVAPAGAHNWTAIDATGSGSTVRGLRISGSTGAPIVNGVVVTGSNVTLDDMTLEGTMDVGVDVRAQGATVQASRFDRLAGTGIRLGDGGASLRQNVFKAAGKTAPPAVQAVGGIGASFDSNVFMHFKRVVEPAARTDELIGQDNFVILASTPAQPARSRR